MQGMLCVYSVNATCRRKTVLRLLFVHHTHKLRASIPVRTAIRAGEVVLMVIAGQRRGSGSWTQLSEMLLDASQVRKGSSRVHRWRQRAWRENRCEKGFWKWLAQWMARNACTCKLLECLIVMNKRRPSNFFLQAQTHAAPPPAAPNALPPCLRNSPLTQLSGSGSLQHCSAT